MQDVLVVNETDQVIENKLQKHNVTNAVIAELKKKYLPLTIKGLDDKEGIKLVKDAKANVRSIRVLAQSVCKEGRSAALAEQRAWIAKEKEVVGEIDIVESHLDKQNEVIENERKRIQEEAELKAREILIQRVQMLMDLGFAFNGVEYSLEDLRINEIQIKQYPDANFAEFTKEALPVFQRIQKEKAEAELLKQEEEARLAYEKARMEELAAKLKAESDRIEEEKRKLELETAKAEATRKAQLQADQDRITSEAKLKAEAEARIEQVKVETENRIKKEQEEKLERERLEQERQKHVAQLAPDRQKLVQLIVKLQSVEIPEVTSDEAKKTVVMVKDLIGKINKYINERIQKM